MNSSSSSSISVTISFKVSLVCTLKLPEFGTCTLRSFLHYHLQKGFQPIFLFFDDPLDKSLDIVQEVSSSSQTDEADPKVVFYRNDGKELSEMWRRCASYPNLRDFISSEVQARQHLNAEVAMQECVKRDIRWLLHIDCDELFYTQKASVIPHFQALEADGVEQMTYMNHEGVPERADVVDYFREITLFRRHYLSLPLTEASRNGMAFWENRTTYQQYMLCYDNGKSAARVRQGTVPASVHSWKLSSAFAPFSSTSLVDPRQLDLSKVRICEDPCILHFVVCGLRWLRSKYEILGRFPDSWFGGRLPIAPSFHLNARDAVLPTPSSLPAGDERDPAKEFFEHQILLNDPKEIARQLEAKVCLRITDVQEILESSSPMKSRSLIPPQTNTVTAASATVKTHKLTPQYTSSKAWMLANIAKNFL